MIPNKKITRKEYNELLEEREISRRLHHSNMIIAMARLFVNNRGTVFSSEMTYKKLTNQGVNITEYEVDCYHRRAIALAGQMLDEEERKDG